MRLRYIGYTTVCLLLAAAFSCSKMDHTYEKFIKDGPIVYPGRPDSVLVSGGRQRALIRWATPTDLNVAGYKVFWNFGADSLLVAGPKPGTTDSASVIIESLPEGTYTFSVYSYDQAGHKSVGTTNIGNVYGEIFQSSITTRAYRTINKSAVKDTLAIVWVGLDSKCIGTEWVYRGADGQPGKVFSPIGDSTRIYSIDVTQPISYRSLFLPEPQAIDTFFTSYKSL